MLERAATGYGVSPDRVSLEITDLSPSLRPGARGSSRMVKVTISPEQTTVHEAVTPRTETR